MTGSVHLTMPVSAWLWLTDRPGEVAGSGSADADTCRDLADRLAAHPATKWCLTLTDLSGRAVAHACAPHGPPAPPRPPVPPDSPAPPGSPGTSGPAATSGPPGSYWTRLRPTGPPGSTGPPGPITEWLGRLRPVYLEAGTCTHQREAPGYRPPPSLRHLITIRQRTCGEPGCLRPAHRCDLDHTIPYHQGGRTCECDLAPPAGTLTAPSRLPAGTSTSPNPAC